MAESNIKMSADINEFLKSNRPTSCIIRHEEYENAIGKCLSDAGTGWTCVDGLFKFGGYTLSVYYWTIGDDDGTRGGFFFIEYS